MEPTLQITVDDLWARIGRQTVEGEMLRAENARLRAHLEAADAEVARLRQKCEGPPAG